MGKFLCDWCSEKEYDIAVLINGNEELLCEDCFEIYKNIRDKDEEF